MRLKTKTKAAIAIILATVLTATIAYATVVIFRDVSIGIKIEAVYGMELYDTDQTTVLTSIDFGVAYRNQKITKPGGTDWFWIKNEGEAKLYYSYNMTNVPSNVTFQVNLEGSILPLNTISRAFTPGESGMWKIEIQVGNVAPFGDFNPTLTWYAHDSATG